MTRFILLFLALSLSAFSSEMKYCIQVAAEKDLDILKSYFGKVKDYPEARIEKREKLYLLRVGAEDRKENLLIMFRKIKNLFPDAYIKKCEINKEYIVYPQQREENMTQGTRKNKTLREAKDTKTAQVQKYEEIKNELKELKSILSDLKANIKHMQREISNMKIKHSEREPTESEAILSPYLEKFIYSAGIFVGGLFLFTWFLLILLYRKIGANNIENINLLNDMFKLIKVLNLLSRGFVIKMDNGKLMVYDKKNDRWKEVE